jgi:hypothetical protein
MSMISELSIHQSACRRAVRCASGWVAPLVGLALLGLGGCAGSAPPPVNTALLAQQAYANNEGIRSVSDALDQRLDTMLATQTASIQQ